jgi:hypothetical protein
MRCVPINMECRRKDPLARGGLRAGIPYGTGTGSRNHSTIPSSYSGSHLSALLRCPRTNQPGSTVRATLLAYLYQRYGITCRAHVRFHVCRQVRVCLCVSPSACACVRVLVRVLVWVLESA